MNMDVCNMVRGQWRDGSREEQAAQVSKAETPEREYIQKSMQGTQQAEKQSAWEGETCCRISSGKSWRVQ